MRILLSIIILFAGIQAYAQPYANTQNLQIYNADELITIAKTKGLSELELIVNPIDLVYVDSSYASTIIDLEFKSRFWEKYPDNNKIRTYKLPDFTLDLAKEFYNAEAGKRLFAYYSHLPKFAKSDTMYYIYNNLDQFLAVLIRYSSPRMIEKLKSDYNDWSKLAQKSAPKTYPSMDEIRNQSLDESLKLKPSDLYVDCNLMALQIAGALNYLKVKGFDNALIEKLKTRQTYPFAKRYSFPKPIPTNLKADPNSIKTVDNSPGIKDFRKDAKKLEELLFDNIDNCCNAQVYQIIVKGNKAHVSVGRNNGHERYTVTLSPDNKISINFISNLIY